MNRDRIISNYLYAFFVIETVSIIQTSTAHADACGRIETGDDNNTIILGQSTELAVEHPVNPVYRPTGVLATCVDGVYEEHPDCNARTSGSVWFYIDAGAGNDVVVPNVVATSDAGNPPVTMCEDGNTDTVIGAFPESFDFHLWVYLGAGADVAYGTKNGDVLFSNRWEDDRSVLSDGASDRLCGYEGNDDLFGDGDEDDSTATRDQLNGGAGLADWCVGGSSTGEYSYAHDSCNNMRNASRTEADYCNAVNLATYWE